MSKKVSFLAVILLVTILLLSACSAPGKTDNDDNNANAQSASSQFADEYEFLDARLAKTDYSHVVTAIQPVNKGGTNYDDYGFRTAFASSELFEDIGMETHISDTDGTRYWMTISAVEPRYWKLTMANSADGGGFIHLPEFILSAEEINVDDIPLWGGQ